MRYRHSTATAMILGLLISFSGGCLSLSMLNRDAPDAKQRLDMLEHRVSALEAADACHSGQPAVTAGPHTQFPGYGLPDTDRR